MQRARISALVVALAVFSSGASVYAHPPKVLHGGVMAGKDASGAFRDSAEAGMLHRAYHILATGDYDYKGHRVRAMRAVKAAANLLGLDLSGDDRDREKQVLSDDRLREAEGLLQQVRQSAAVQAQKPVVKHLRAAINNIRVALRVR